MPQDLILADDGELAQPQSIGSRIYPYQTSKRRQRGRFTRGIGCLFRLFGLLILAFCLIMFVVTVNNEINYSDFTRYKTPGQVENYFNRMLKVGQAPQTDVQTFIDKYNVRQCEYSSDSKAIICTLRGPVYVFFTSWYVVTFSFKKGILSDIGAAYVPDLGSL